MTRSGWVGIVAGLAALAVLWASGATRPLAAESPLSFTEIADGVFVHAGEMSEATAANGGDIANIGFVVGNDAVAMIDSGGSAAVARAALAGIQAVTGKPVRYLINTHMHPDHVFGNAVFRAAGAEIVGHRRLPAALSARAEHYLASMTEQIGRPAVAEVEIVPLETTVDSQLALDLGGRTLRLQAWDTAHTDNDLTVFDEATGTLFAGDLVFVDHVPIIDGSLLGWLEQTDDLAAVPAQRVVPGHGPISAPWPEALAAQTRYLEALAADLRAAIASGIPLTDAIRTAGAGEAEKWEMFDFYHPRNATAAFAELEWE